MQKKYLWIDFLKSFAAFAVIVVHVCAPVLYNFANQHNWQIANVYGGLVRFCVPIFVMISGVLLLEKSEELTFFLRKRFSRLLFPFIFWSLIYLSLKINYDLQLKEIISFSTKQLRSGTQYHLWYIYMLIGLYLFIPILSKWSVNATKKEMIYFLGICLFLMFLNLPLFNQLFTRIDFRYFSGYIGYLVLGTFLHRYVDLKSKWMAFFFFLFGVGITIFITYYLSLSANSLISKYYDFLSLNVAIASTGLFLLFKNIIIKNIFFKKIIIIISKYSYGIYLSHVLVLICFGKIGLTYMLFNLWITIPMISLCCLAISLLLTFCLSKIPLIGKYISG